MNAGRSERSSVVASDGVGKTVLAEKPQKLPFDAIRAEIEEAVAAEQIAAEVIGDGDRGARLRSWRPPSPPSS